MKREPRPRVSCRLNSMMQHGDYVYIYIQVRAVKMRIYKKERPDEALSLLLLSLLLLRRSAKEGDRPMASYINYANSYACIV